MINKSCWTVLYFHSLYSVRVLSTHASKSQGINLHLVLWKHLSADSHGRYNLTIQSMIEFRLKMIQFNFRFKRKLSIMIQFNFQFKRKLSGFNSKNIQSEKKPKIQLKKYSIQNYSRPIQFNNIFNSKLLLANSIQ